MHKYIKLMISIVICQLAGVAGSVFTFPNITTWYAALNKPAFTPPNWVFGPVWLTLYTLMGISLWLIWEKKAEKKKRDAAFCVFGAQLALNASWSFLFFGLRSPFAGLVILLTLITMLGYTMFRFYKIDRRATYLLVPYLLWVMVATYLNFGVWVLN